MAAGGFAARAATHLNHVVAETNVVIDFTTKGRD
jgi:hypothetical protein